MKFALGQKIGMTRVFNADGKALAVTLVKALPMVVKQVKTSEKDGYSAIVVRAFEKKGDKEKDLETTEFRVLDPKEFKAGQKIEIELLAGDKIAVQGTGKGKGFAGTIKRHNFRRGPESHGGNNVREPGSIGAQQPQRVVKGRRMAGHMGVETVTIQNLSVFDLDKEIILISGAIPGPRKSIVRIYTK